MVSTGWLGCYRCFIYVLICTGAFANAIHVPAFADGSVVTRYLSDRMANTPDAIQFRRDVSSGPAALARELAAASKEGVLIRLDQIQRPVPPADENAAPVYRELVALLKQKPMTGPLY